MDNRKQKVARIAPDRALLIGCSKHGKPHANTALLAPDRAKNGPNRLGPSKTMALIASDRAKMALFATDRAAAHRPAGSH